LIPLKDEDELKIVGGLLHGTAEYLVGEMRENLHKG
jgi:hypothetical protein